MNRFLMLISAAALMACGSTSISPKTAQSTDVTEVIYFHGRQRCVTCNEIERLSREVVDSMGDTMVVMRIIDISTPEGEQVADVYQVSWSSLYVERDGTAENMTDMGFSYAKGQPETFKAKLMESIKNISK